jgi:prepilin-type N-terminal cleavage/methylation domain-containing protein
MQRFRNGFSLIELIIVLGILGVLFVIVISQVTSSGMRPGNAQRRADVNKILAAIEAYGKQHNGSLPSGLTDEQKTITSTPGPSTLDLCQSLVPSFLTTIPLDPGTGLAVPISAKCNAKGARYSSGYTVQTASGKVRVNAPAADNGETIFVTN